MLYYNTWSNAFKKHLAANWKAGLTVACISVPLSITLSIASGAGPVPGLITGVWATLLASIFGGNNFNIIGAAGALTTVLFAATLAAPLGLGAAVLPLLALTTGLIILCVWALRADRFLYYIPSSVMYGFATGVAITIAASQLFDATGLSALKRTGHFIGDIELYVAHAGETEVLSVIVFGLFLGGMLFLKRNVPQIPAIIPASIAGIAFGAADMFLLPAVDLVTLGDKFGAVSGALMEPVAWSAIPALVATRESLLWLLQVSGIIALIAVLETLITAKIADNITHTESSTRRELFGLSLANLGSGAMGGLPATGVFIRTGANIKAGATHKTSAGVAAVATGLIALVAMPFFSYLPMAIIAAMLVNTAIGLIEIEKFKEFWRQEKSSFAIALMVTLVVVFEDAGVGVALGSVVALLLFADRISHGRFDIILNYTDGTKEEHRGARVLRIPVDKEMPVVTYSIAGFLGYIDSARHARNLRNLAHAPNVGTVIIRLRDLFTIDYEGREMLAEAVYEFGRAGKQVCISSASHHIAEQLHTIPALHDLIEEGRFYSKTRDALTVLLPSFASIHAAKEPAYSHSGKHWE